ncbi:hypothetical protein CVT26_011648 [Gymnopilus dilepis]|uniref:Uncharacterized protein n=1 Tax=Gymnopilus dilepis TaxID=231916 RepID=A0A409WSK3_9AGAR|nr:hypothetical protein CVT26_011648 [Gymnopilus dilepis]
MACPAPTGRITTARITLVLITVALQVQTRIAIDYLTLNPMNVDLRGDLHLRPRRLMVGMTGNLFRRHLPPVVEVVGQEKIYPGLLSLQIHGNRVIPIALHASTIPLLLNAALTAVLEITPNVLLTGLGSQGTVVSPHLAMVVIITSLRALSAIPTLRRALTMIAIVLRQKTEGIGTPGLIQ